MELAGDVISGHTLDNRASVAVLTVCLEELQVKSHVWDVWAVATVQEETSYLGGYTSSFQLRPDIAIAVDGTFAKGPGANGWQTHPMGRGVGICMGPNMHPHLHKKLTELADKLEIPWFLDVTPKHSGTDAYPMQTTLEGIPTALVEYPLRYMHTTVESVAVKDIQRAGRLLAEFIASLEADFVGYDRLGVISCSSRCPSRSIPMGQAPESQDKHAAIWKHTTQVVGKTLQCDRGLGG
jgi:tetrahedral aminopeptidase